MEDFLKEKLRKTHSIDGLFIATGSLSSATIRCLIKLEVKLQTDIQLIGFDRMDVVPGVAIPYVKQPLAEMCRSSFDILLNEIELHDKKIIDCKLFASIVTDNC